MLSTEEAVAFHGVGRLNVAGTRFCTATLISEEVIATAAHCLFHPRSRERVPLSEFRFVAGLRMGKAAAVRRVARAALHPDFTFEGLASREGVAADLALLELAEPVPAEDAPAFAPGALGQDGAPIAIVSYARDRAQAPSIEAPCEVVVTFAGVTALDCAVNYGASGAPVLQGGEADRRLVAVVSAMGSVVATADEVTLAVLVGPWIEPLLAALAAEPREE
jgi:V8-like Glu-specific endopeptidase